MTGVQTCALPISKAMQEKYGDRWINQISPEEEQQYNDLLNYQENAEKSLGYQSSHWEGTPNVLAHIRMSDRGYAFQKPFLHVEEVQSDWGQQGRDYGFRSGPAKEMSPDDKAEYLRIFNIPQSKRTGEQQDRFMELRKQWDEGQMSVPHGPHVGSTDAWTDLALKRILQEAAKGNYEEILFTNGKDQSDRYGLDKNFTSIQWSPDTNELIATGDQNNYDMKEKVDKSVLHKFIGKDLATKLLAQDPKVVGNKQVHILSGEDMKVENKGMRDYYDRKLPERMNKLVSKLDPSVKMNLFAHTINLGTETDDGEDRIHHLHSLKMTPKLREAILKGLPAFEHGGSVIKRGLDVLSKLSQ